MVLLRLVLCSLLLCATAFTQETPSHKAIDKKFVGLGVALFTATTFDLETTFNCVQRHTCRETNPLLAPLIKSGRPATYAFEGGLNTGIMYMAYKLRKSHNPVARKIWWVVPVAGIGLHTFAGGANLRFSFR